MIRGLGIALTAWLSVAAISPVGAAPPSSGDALIWGIIPPHQVEMESYSGDPAASAVILGSYGNLDIGMNFSMVHEEHRRVKVFSEAGYDLATVEFEYSPQQHQRLDLLEGQTFVPDGSGGLERVDLQRSDIYEDRVGDRVRVRFTLPALQSGAIFEYRYRITSNRMYWIRDWVFQHSEPAMWSEFRVRVPAWITLNRHPVGNPNFFLEEIDEEPFGGVDRRGFRGETEWRAGPQLNSFRWVMRDVQALREEPYVASIRNHAYAMRLEYAGYYERQGSVLVYQAVAHSWADVAEQLLDHSRFGRAMRATRALRNQVAEVTAGADSETESLERIYDFVRKHIVYNGQRGLYTSGPLERVLENRSGSGTEVNLLLITMLQEAGLSADPVLVSTRRNGEVRRWFASARQFNHVIAQVHVNRRAILVDATDRHLPLGMLPVAVLNGRALALTETGPDWLRIEPPSSVRTIEVDAVVGSDGRISGVMTGRVDGYPALALRHAIAEVGNAAHDYEIDETGRRFVEVDALRFSEATFDGIDGDGPISFELRFETDAAAQAMDHLLTFEPVLAWRVERNPFQAPERTFPVDFAYPMADTYVARFTLPDGFEADERIGNVRLSSDRGRLSYARAVTLVGGTLQIRRIYGRRSAVFFSDEYHSVREVYDGITAADAERMVLVREGTTLTSSGDQRDE